MILADKGESLTHHVLVVRKKLSMAGQPPD